MWLQFPIITEIQVDREKQKKQIRSATCVNVAASMLQARVFENVTVLCRPEEAAWLRVSKHFNSVKQRSGDVRSLWLAEEHRALIQ